MQQMPDRDAYLDGLLGLRSVRAATGTCGRTSCLCPVAHGTGRRDVTGCLAVPLGRALVGRLPYRRCRLDSPSKSKICDV